MRANTIGIPVKDQEKALQFYTQKLGFVTKYDKPLGGGNRWLTVVSKDAPDGVQLLLEPAPNHFKPAKVYQEELYKAGIPYTQFDVDNLDEEYKRLIAEGVEFSVMPTASEDSKYAILDDTCGNKIALVELL